MSSANDRLIKAIRDIVGIKPEAIELLNAIGKRGTLKGVTVAADIAADQDECCSEKGNDPPPDGPCDTQPGTIWCNPDDPWKDCQTGQPVTIGAGGFPQQETCKDCTYPDPTWEEGKYIIGNDNSVRDKIYTSPGQCHAEMPDTINLASTIGGPCVGCKGPVLIQGDLVRAVYTLCDGPPEYCDGAGTSAPQTISGGRIRDCPSSPVGNQNVNDACAAEEAPEIEDCIDWESNGNKDLAVINGCITGSSCDPDATGADEKCKQCQDLCNAAGQTMRVCATPDGGFVAYDPNGELKGGKYSSDGTRTEQYDAGDSGGWV